MCSVLDSLEREYKREDDWISRHPSSSGLGAGLDDPNNDRVALILQLINKHQEQKEAFLKACTLARRTAETFLKYSNRSLQYFCHGQQQSSFRGPEAKVKGDRIFSVSCSFNDACHDVGFRKVAFFVIRALTNSKFAYNWYGFDW